MAFCYHSSDRLSPAYVPRPLMNDVEGCQLCLKNNGEPSKCSKQGRDITLLQKCGCGGGGKKGSEEASYKEQLGQNRIRDFRHF